MKCFIEIIVFLIGDMFLQTPIDSLPSNLPKAMEGPVKLNQMKHSKIAFVFDNSTWDLSHEMHLISDEEGLPLLYYADIQSPVCIDGICKPLFIEMYWDLKGKYVGYGEYPDEVLSKFDHEDFNHEDYDKLHDLLLDDNSILGLRELSDLYDIKKERKVAITFKGVEVDGVSGATKEEIKTAIVDGALYSCYMLWHLANGEARSKINSLLPEIYNTALAESFLYSDYKAYRNYALIKMPKDEFENNIEQIVRIIIDGSPVERAYSLKKIPKEQFRNPLLAESLFANIDQLDFNAKTLLVTALEHSTPAAVLAVSEKINRLSKNQLKLFLRIMESNSGFQSDEILESLYNCTIDNTYTYNYMISKSLSNIEIKRD